MNDRAGNELEVGDWVLYISVGNNTNTSLLKSGHIASFTPKMVKIYPDDHPVQRQTVTRRPDRVVKPFTEPCIYDCSICHEDEDEY